jgi:hypothetical protein
LKSGRTAEIILRSCSLFQRYREELRIEVYVILVIFFEEEEKIYYIPKSYNLDLKGESVRNFRLPFFFSGLRV